MPGSRDWSSGSRRPGPRAGASEPSRRRVGSSASPSEPGRRSGSRPLAEIGRDCCGLCVVTDGDTTSRLYEPIRDPARLDRHEVTKVAHHHRSVDATTKPIEPGQDPVPYRGPKRSSARHASGWPRAIFRSSRFPGTADAELHAALLRCIGGSADWDPPSDRARLDAGRALVKAAYGEEPPLVVDPFAGGGSIRSEALRVGSDTFASDLDLRRSPDPERDAGGHPASRPEARPGSRAASPRRSRRRSRWSSPNSISTTPTGRCRSTVSGHAAYAARRPSAPPRSRSCALFGSASRRAASGRAQLTAGRGGASSDVSPTPSGRTSSHTRDLPMHHTTAE